MKIKKPKEVSENHLNFLDNLRESGETNMFGAIPYLIKEFPKLKKSDAARILVYWMKTFGKR